MTEERTYIAQASGASTLLYNFKFVPHADASLKAALRAKRVVALDKVRPAEALWEILIEEKAGEAFDAAAVEDARGHPKAAVLTHQMGFAVMNQIADLMPSLGPQHASVGRAPLRRRRYPRWPPIASYDPGTTCCSDSVT